MVDVVFLSRLQFAFTIMFHYLFPPLTIGMGVVLVYLEGMFLWKREPIYETAARFWTSLYAVSFAVGVATGIVMEFQFGTNWAVYSRFVGDVFGSALAAVIPTCSSCTNASRKQPWPPDSNPICAHSIRTSQSHVVGTFRPKPFALS